MPGAQLRGRGGYCRVDIAPAAIVAPGGAVLARRLPALLDPSSDVPRPRASFSPAFARSLSAGPDSLTWTLFGASTPGALAANARNVLSGSIVLAWAAMGTIGNLSAPTDNKGNTYSPLLAAHNYVNWPTSGQRLYAATGVIGDAALVVSEARPDITDETTLSMVAVQGTTITNAAASETPTTGPVTTPSVTVAGPAILVSTWWGDGTNAQASVNPSAGWTKLHELNNSVQLSGLVQVALAVRAVGAGTYSCTWTADDGQGGVAYIVSVE